MRPMTDGASSSAGWPKIAKPLLELLVSYAASWPNFCRQFCGPGGQSGAVLAPA